MVCTKLPPVLFCLLMHSSWIAQCTPWWSVSVVYLPWMFFCVPLWNQKHGDTWDMQFGCLCVWQIRQDMELWDGTGDNSMIIMDPTHTVAPREKQILPTGLLYVSFLSDGWCLSYPPCANGRNTHSLSGERWQAPQKDCHFIHRLKMW